MRCPTCAEALNAETLDQLTTPRCPVCRGMWLAKGQLGRAVRECNIPDTRFPGPEVRAASAALRCPACGCAMVPFNYAHDSGVLINRCARCAGVWLESGQLERLAQYRESSPAVKSLEIALAGEARRTRRWRLARKLVRSRVLSGIVAASYLLILLLLTGGFELVARAAIAMALPMMCIWFPDVLGNLRGISLGIGRPVITEPTPGDAVAAGGWLVLLAYASVMVILLARIR